MTSKLFSITLPLGLPPKRAHRAKAHALHALVLGLALLAPRLAYAGCLSSGNEGCIIPRDVTVTFTPDQQCLEVRQELNECVCMVELFIKNTCEVPLDAQDFEWVMITPYLQGYPHLSLPSGYEGAINVQPNVDDPEGPTEKTFHFLMETEEVSVTVNYDAERYSMGGCSMAAVTPSSSLLVLIAGLGLLVLRRDRRRHR